MDAASVKSKPIDAKILITWMGRAELQQCCLCESGLDVTARSVIHAHDDKVFPPEPIPFVVHSGCAGRFEANMPTEDYSVRACEKFEGDRGELACNRCRWSRAMHPSEIKPVTEAEEAYRLAANRCASLVIEKQAAYGDSFGKAGRILRELYPEGIKPEQLDDALTIVRVVDKLFRIATKKDAFGESPWKDIMGYALLSVVRDGKK